jgi:hypothetical protein
MTHESKMIMLGSAIQCVRALQYVCRLMYICDTSSLFKVLYDKRQWQSVTCRRRALHLDAPCFVLKRESEPFSRSCTCTPYEARGPYAAMEHRGGTRSSCPSRHSWSHSSLSVTSFVRLRACRFVSLIAFQADVFSIS